MATRLRSNSLISASPDGLGRHIPHLKPGTIWSHRAQAQRDLVRRGIGPTPRRADRENPDLQATLRFARARGRHVDFSCTSWTSN